MYKYLPAGDQIQGITTTYSLTRLDAYSFLSIRHQLAHLKPMNERQRTVLGVAVIALIVVILFFVPWRIESTDEIKWAPAYRQPVASVRSYKSDLHDTHFAYEDGEIALGVFALQILGIGLVGAAAFLISADDRD